MAKFRKYEKQALELHSKKKAEREDNEKKRKDRLAQKKKEEEISDAKSEASITELTDDEALQLQKEIDKVYVNFSFLVINLMFVSSVHANTTAFCLGMGSASVLTLARFLLHAKGCGGTYNVMFVSVAWTNFYVGKNVLMSSMRLEQAIPLVIPRNIRFAIGAAVALLQNKGTHLLPTCTLLSAVWKMCNLWFVAANILCSWYVMHHGCLFSSTLLLFPGTGYLVAWLCRMAVLQPWVL